MGSIFRYAATTVRGILERAIPELPLKYNLFILPRSVEVKNSYAQDVPCFYTSRNWFLLVTHATMTSNFGSRFLSPPLHTTKQCRSLYIHIYTAKRAARALFSNVFWFFEGLLSTKQLIASFHLQKMNRSSETWGLSSGEICLPFTITFCVMFATTHGSWDIKCPISMNEGYFLNPFDKRRVLETWRWWGAGVVV